MSLPSDPSAQPHPDGRPRVRQPGFESHLLRSRWMSYSAPRRRPRRSYLPAGAVGTRSEMTTINPRQAVGPWETLRPPLVPQVLTHMSPCQAGGLEGNLRGRSVLAVGPGHQALATRLLPCVVSCPVLSQGRPGLSGWLGEGRTPLSPTSPIRGVSGGPPAPARSPPEESTAC